MHESVNTWEWEALTHNRERCLQNLKKEKPQLNLLWVETSKYLQWQLSINQLSNVF